jgi:ABC-2 type transport system permease protein
VTTAQERADRLGTEQFQVSGRVRKSFLNNLVAPVREIFQHRELLGLLVRRELKSRYKDSSLGFLWSLIKPLTMLLIYYVAIGQFLGAARGIPDFAIFVFAGLTLWGLYSEIVFTGTKSIIVNAPLVRKVYLPREIFPLAATGSALFNFAIQLIVLLGAIVVLGQFPFSWKLVYALIAIVIVLIYGVALAILLSALNVYLRDVEYLVEVGLLVFFWASPIVYSWSYVVDAGVRSNLPWLEWVYLLNPISNAMLAFQVGVWKAGSESRVLGDLVVKAQAWPADLDIRLLVVAVVGVILLWVSQRVFSRLQGNFAQEI